MKLEIVNKESLEFTSCLGFRKKVNLPDTFMGEIVICAVLKSVTLYDYILCRPYPYDASLTLSS